MTLTLRGRILMTLIPVLAVLVVLAACGFLVVSHLGGRANAILRENYDSVIAMERLRESVERIDSSFQFTLSGEEAKARAQYEANWATYRDALRFEHGNITLAGEKELADELTVLTDRYRQQGDAFYARAANDPFRRQDYFGSPGLLETFTQIKSVSGRIAQINQVNMEEASGSAKQTARMSLIGSGIALALTLVLAGFASWQIYKMVFKPIRAVTESARSVGAGNLDLAVPYLSRGAIGELSEAFNQMTQRLKEREQSTQKKAQELATTAETLRKELSEREKMEQSLRQLASIVESSDDAIFTRGPDGAITSWNKGAERVFGYPAEAVLGQSEFILVPPELESEFAEISERVQRGEPVEHFETVRRRKDGERIWVSLACFPVRDSTGAITGVASIDRDITERKRAEDKIRQASAYNRSLIEASLDPLVTIGPGGKITDVNAATEAVTGRPRTKLVGTDFADYFTKPERAREGYQRVFSEGSVRDYPLEIRHRDGRVTSVLYNAAIFRDESGNVVGAFAAARDVCERKKAEQALRQSEANLKRAQAVAHIGSWYLEVPRNELLWTEETYRMFGFPPGTPLTYEKFLEAVHPDDRGAVNQAWTAALNGATYDIEHRIVVDGQTKWVRERAELERDADGRVRSGIGTVQDITERKQREKEVRRLAQLQSAVAELGLRALGTESTGDLLNGAVQVVVYNTGVELCNVLELLPGGEEFLLRAGHGWKDGLVGQARIRVNGTQPGHVVHSEHPVIVADASTETRFALLPRLLGDEVASAMSVVIATPEGPYGALGAHSRRLRTFTQDEVDFLQAVANVLGSAIQRQRFEQRLQRSNRALLALSNCNQALIHATDEASLLQQVCKIVVEAAGYRLCWVGYAERDETQSVRPMAQAGFEEGYLETLKITWADTERGRGPTGTSIRTGQTSVVRDIASDLLFEPWRAEALKRGYNSAASIPLIADSTTLGALNIYAAEVNAFSQDEVQLLAELAADLAFGIVTLRTREERRKAVALQAAQEREIKIGTDIQKALLAEPPPTDLRGLGVAAISVPSRQIDGDFYYFYRHDDRRIDLLVADVMGKGIPAALLAAATKSHFLETLCHLLDVSPPGSLPQPKDIVTLAHASMAQHLIDLESFVTLCYVRIDSERQTIEFVDAGHTGLIHLTAATGRCEILHGENLPLGFRKTEIYNQQTAAFDSDDLLILYSDGITEARNRSDELFGEERLKECIETHRSLGPEDIANAVRRAVFAFTETDSPADDLTCVVVRFSNVEHPQAGSTLTLRSDLQELSRARQFVRDFCRDLPGSKLDDDAVGRLELAVTEACSNIMKHAYHGRSDQEIVLDAEVFPDRLAIRLHHLGDAFDPSKAPQPRFDGRQDSGFGVYLISQSVDEVHQGRDDWGRNCVVLTKRR
jgi:PAS domain S-box-containing protein